ncbi:MAG TPA: helix-turn-helix transcriptional regulator [Mycobacteriales bacterium]|nr:helix-turn-helix transcriptional regulator [Mycobacteriales bacterium]
MASSSRGPSLRAQWLGKELREAREGAKLTLKEAGAYLQRDQSTVSRFEAGVFPARMPDVLALLDLYGIADPERRAALLELSRDAWQRGWWDSYTNHVDRGVLDFAFLESRATEIKTFVPLVLFSLFQTREYAEATIRAADPTAGGEQVEHWLALRMARRDALAERDAPLRLRMVVDEGCLRRVVGGVKIMRAQLAHLAEMAGESMIDIRVLPFSSGGHASPEGQFSIVLMPEPYPDVACVDTRAGSLYVEDDAAERYTLAFDRLTKDALGLRRSVEFIRAVAEELG